MALIVERSTQLRAVWKLLTGNGNRTNRNRDNAYAARLTVQYSHGDWGGTTIAEANAGRIRVEVCAKARVRGRPAAVGRRKPRVNLY